MSIYSGEEFTATFFIIAWTPYPCLPNEKNKAILNQQGEGRYINCQYPPFFQKGKEIYQSLSLTHLTLLLD